MEHTIDAKGKKIGRIATEAAVILMGKDSPAFAKNTVAPAKVKIVNASLASISEDRMKNKTYKRYSGYPGGLKEETLEHVAKRKGYGELFKNAVYGMIPRNKLRAKIMKNLTVNE